MKLLEILKGIIGLAIAWLLIVLFLSACSCEQIQTVPALPTQQAVDSLRTDFENEKSLSDDLWKGQEVYRSKTDQRLDQLEFDYSRLRQEFKEQDSLIVDKFTKEIETLKIQQDSLQFIFTEQEKKFLFYVDSVKGLTANRHTFKLDSTSFKCGWLKVIDLDDSGLETEGVTYNVRVNFEVQSEDASGNLSPWTEWDGTTKGASE